MSATLPADAPSPRAITIGSIFIDDIVLPDGRTHMEVLGGGSTHAAAGALIWGERVGIAASTGAGLPQSAAARLHAFDLRGVVELEHPQVRAWQVFEWDGRRTEVFRVPIMLPFMTTPRTEEVTRAYDGAEIVHILRDGEDARAGRTRFPHATIFWEPNQHFMQPEHRAEFRQTAAQVDVLSPNLVEAQTIYGDGGNPAPDDLVRAMLDDGARVVLLRLGELGSMVGVRGDNGMTLHRIPALPVPRVVDQTGAGNTYCGGFMAGWLKTGDPVQAAMHGAVSASFALETMGVLAFERVQPEQRDRRYRWIAERSRAL